VSLQESINKPGISSRQLLNKFHIREFLINGSERELMKVNKS